MIYIEKKFSLTYYLAGEINEVIENANDDFLMDYFDPSDSVFQDKLLKANKKTILHDFIEIYFNNQIEIETDKLDPDSIRLEREDLLKTYNISFDVYDASKDDEEYELLSNHVDYLRKLITDQLSVRISNETFELLFANRKFCLRFNKKISEIIKPLKAADYPSLLEKDGMIKRCTYFQEWVQRAIYFRDQGKCAVKQEDLSGLITTDYKDAIDHIVPLKLGGNNDITNFQLICQPCNLQKLDHTMVTSDKYPTFF